MKVLISASSCAPGDSRAAGAAWAWCRAAALQHDVWLLTTSESAAAIARELAERPLPGLTVLPLDVPWRHRHRWSGPIWQRHANQEALRLHERHGFAVIHHLTAGPMGAADAAARPATAKVVWGPVGLSTAVPLTLARWLGPAGLVAELVRRAGAALVFSLYGRRAARQADLVVAQDNDVAGLLGRATRVVVEPAVAVRPVSSAGGPSGRAGATGTRTAVFAGRLVPDKGLLLAISALARPAAARWELRVMGDGPEWRRAERLAEHLGVRDRIEFRGEVPRQQILAALLRADALVAPWLQAPAAWTVADALARGCPVVCLDRGAPAALVGPGEGVVVPWRGDVVAAFAKALGSLAGRIEPVARWSPDRLPEILAGWYSPEHARR
ncbi:MAG TPA: glycosyltransferase [Kribbella sp.]|nr:glycosyltransferase [Kribbella sp.]